jgi:AcrR family transcriptional regulator
MQTVSRSPGRPRDESLPQRRREEILVAATKLWASKGYPNTDLDSVASDLKLAKGTLYRYFSSKEEMFHAAVDRAMQLLQQWISDMTTPVEEPLERIRTAVKAFLTFFDDHPELLELIIQERAEFRNRKDPTFVQYRARNIGPWQKLIEDLMDEGRVRAMPVARVTNVLSCALYGALFTNYYSRHQPLANAADEIIDITFRGILTNDQRANQI